MTPTRLSKIARLPANIREQLNRRLHDGKLSKSILPWVNSLPETKEVLAENFNSKPITHQNLSEWRRAGYQDWLFHQQRLEWNGRLAEEEAEITKQNRCEDGYEATGFRFLYEISQALKSLQEIKNNDKRFDRLQTLTREFARLQNAFNWSRRVGLEFDKHNASGTGVSPVSSYSHRRDARATNQTELEPASPLPEIEDRAASPNADGASTPPATNAPNLTKIAAPPETATPKPPSLAAPKPREDEIPGALPDAPRNSEPSDHRASPALAPSDHNSLTLKPLNSSTPPSSQPIPALALTTQPLNSNSDLPTPDPQPPRPYKVHSIPIRGRRFVSIEG